jgi:hypothetical protein
LRPGKTKRFGKPIFTITGSVKKKHQAEVKRIADLTREIVKAESVYRGKAVKLITNESGVKMQGLEAPEPFSIYPASISVN